MTCWACNLRPEERWKCLDRSMGQYEQHHLLTQQVLRREFPRGAFWEYGTGRWHPISRQDTWPVIDGSERRTLAQLLADPRNLVPVGRWHHAQIENRRVNPTWDDLPLQAVEFADELGLAHLLERRYPEGLAA